MERKIRLGELLMRANLISEERLNAALAEQQKWGGRLGKILVDMNCITEDILLKALCKQLNMPRASFEYLGAVPPQILQKADRSFCEQNQCVPINYSHTDRALQVALFDPSNLRVLDDLKFRTGLRVVPALAGERAIAQAIIKLFHPLGVTPSGMAAVPAAPASGALPPGPRPGPQSSGSFPATPPAAAPSLEEIEQQQRRQGRAIRMLFELLVEKGAFTREEYNAWISRRQG
jgi:hypothetical protein